MTEKRFIIFEKEDKSISIKDTYEGVNYPMLDWGSAKDTEELLNKLAEENQSIKKHIRELYKIVKINVDNEIEVYPKVLLEYIINILKIIGDV